MRKFSLPLTLIVWALRGVITTQAETTLTPVAENFFRGACDQRATAASHAGGVRSSSEMTSANADDDIMVRYAVATPTATLYTSPAAFDAAIAGLGTATVVNFDELNADPINNSHLGRPVFDGTFYADQGITFASVVGESLYVAPGGLFWNDSNSLSVNFFPFEPGSSANDSLLVSFALPQHAAGFTVVDAGGGQSVQFLDSSGAVIAETGMPPEYAPYRRFVGLVSESQAVASINIIDPANDGDDVDYDDLKFVLGMPVITSPLSAITTIGLAFSYQFEATGATSIGVDESSLPPGLIFDSTLHAIIGNPTVDGTFQVGLSASNLDGTTFATLSLTVQPAPASGPVIISITSATGRTGNPFNFQVATAGGTPATRLSATGLPPGLTADPMTGEISGTATTDGSFLVTLSVTDAGLTNTATLQLTFTSDPAMPVIVSANNAFLFPGLAFEYMIEAPTSDSTDPITYSEVGPLPSGLGLDPATGIISGTPNLGAGLQPVPSLAGGIVTNVQIFACNSSGCAAQGILFLLPTGAENISTRLSVGTGDNVLIGGFIILGNAPMKLVVRGIGPSLTQFGIIGALADPSLELHDSTGAAIGTNDNWMINNKDGTSQAAAILATKLAPGQPPMQPQPKESAILAVLDPGAYTGIVSSKGATGVGLVEVYNLATASLDVSSEAHLANISTRGNVQTDANVMIGGFINKGATPIQVLVRGIGPSLTPFGVSGALANPTLELHKPDGTVITNDDWTTDPTQKAAIMATGLAPTNALESAILLTLPVGEGAYTAIVSGANTTTGVGLVEAYFGDPCLGTLCP
jgi:Putative Ig domain